MRTRLGISTCWGTGHSRSSATVSHVTACGRPPRARAPRVGRVTGTGRSPGSRVLALPPPSRACAQWRRGGGLAAHSCGGSSGLAPSRRRYVTGFPFGRLQPAHPYRRRVNGAARRLSMRVGHRVERWLQKMDGAPAEIPSSTWHQAEPSDFMPARKCSMKSRATGFGVLFFSITSATGHARAGSLTGKTFTGSRKP